MDILFGKLFAMELFSRNGSETGVAPNRRFRQINQRIITLSTQVETLIRKLEENNCRSMPCQNGGVCMDLFDGFLCQCPKNWEVDTVIFSYQLGSFELWLNFRDQLVDWM